MILFEGHQMIKDLLLSKTLLCCVQFKLNMWYDWCHISLCRTCFFLLYHLIVVEYIQTIKHMVWKFSQDLAHNLFENIAYSSCSLQFGTRWLYPYSSGLNHWHCVNDATLKNWGKWIRSTKNQYCHTNIKLTGGVHIFRGMHDILWITFFRSIIQY